jgi:hypothetical protein
MVTGQANVNPRTLACPRMVSSRDRIHFCPLAVDAETFRATGTHANHGSIRLEEVYIKLRGEPWSQLQVIKRLT